MFIQSAPTPDCEQVSQHLEQRTRERVLEAVSEHGPLTAAELGRHLGLTPAAVRRHLDALAEQSVVEEHDPSAGASRGRGRPARSWVVSEAGHRSLAGDYDELAAQTLRFLAAQAGPEAVDAFARERVAGLETRYAGRLAAAGDLPHERVDALVAALTEDGYAASARPVGNGVGPFTGIQLCQGHCPVGRVAEEFPAFCDAETDAISRLLGVHVQRLATLAGGAHVCTTFIPTPNPAAHASSTSPGVSQPVGRPIPTGPSGTPVGRQALNHEGPQHRDHHHAAVDARPDHPHERSSR